MWTRSPTNLFTDNAFKGGWEQAPKQERPNLDVKKDFTSFQPRYHKLSFPTYEGKEDPLARLNRCDQFFRGQGISEHEKV